MPACLRLLAVVLLIGTPAVASTGFNVAVRGDVQHYAISTGWYSPARAALALNPRNLERNGAVDASVTNAPVWTSRYWSLTQSMFGVGFPMSGVNERGLIIQSTVLRDRRYPEAPPRARPLVRSQWTQYHLDTSASLAEVIAKSVAGEHPVIPQSTLNAEFQVCDIADCAVIAYYDGKAVAHGSMGRIEVDLATGTRTDDRAARWPWGTIANHLLSENIAAFERCAKDQCADLNDSLKRFNMVTTAVQGYGKGAVDLPRVFADLRKVDQGFPKTTWNEVYSVQRRGDRVSVRLSFKKPDAPMERLQWVEVSGTTPGVDCGSAPSIWWLDLNRDGGDRSSEHVPHSRAAQELLAHQHIKENGGVFPREAIEPLVTAPESRTRCLAHSTL